MALLKNSLQILVIEDNPGDRLLIEEYLLEEAETPALHFAKTLQETVSYFEKGHSFDAVLLDLTLPDASGESLVKRVVDLSENTPVIVLTGYENLNFGIKTLRLGVADYLLKDQLNSFLLSKSISYSIERHQINESLKYSEQKYWETFNLSPQPMWMFDPETLEFLDVNKAAVDNYGYSREEFLEMTLRDIYPDGELTRLENFVSRFRSQKNIHQTFVSRHATKKGELLDVEVKCNKFELLGDIAGLILANDITEKLKAEREIKLSEQKFKALVQDGSDLIAILDPEGNYTYVAPTSETVLGIPAEEFIGTNAFDYIHGDDQQRIMNHLSNLDYNERVEIDPFQFKVGEEDWRWIKTTLTNMLENPSVQGFVSNSRDVTDHIERERKLQESLERYHIVANATSDTIYELNLQNDKIEYCTNLMTVFGYNEQEMKREGSWWRDKIHPEDRQDYIDQIDEAALKNLSSFSMEYRFKAADGRYKHIYDLASVTFDSKNNPARLIGAMQDITERKQQDLEIRESLKEKETLLMEIHHRVKNNLAVVSGMMQLQAYQEADERVGQKLFDSVGRIKTMATIHELLYQSASFSNLKLGENIKKLISSIIKSFQISVDLDTDFNLEPIELNINQAIPCSLIVNEVVTNVLKHAFEDGESGTLSVSLTEKHKRIILIIKDDGKGLPENFESIAKDSSLGLQLIDTLATQLNADYSYQSLSPGASFTLEFEKSQVKGIGSTHFT